MKEDQIIADLSHSYFNHILREVKPFLECFDCQLLCNIQTLPKYNSSEGAINLRSDTDYELIERLFFMACLHTKDITIPFKYEPPLKCSGTIKKNDWLSDIRPFGSKSKQGVVSKSLIFDNFYIVVKRAKTSKFDEITTRDFCVGINLNKIINEAPFFVRTLGCFNHKNQFHIATEFVDGISLKTFIQNPKTTFYDFLNVFFQILLGLEVAQNKLNFSHYDLHTDNVILVPQNQELKVSLYGCNYTIKNKYRPVMIDFGLSSVHTKGQTLGQKNLENKCIYNHITPGYDIYIFLLFCIDVAQTTNMAIFKGITDLLTFFKLETNLSVELLINNHIQSLKKGVSNLTPNKFINYLIRTYSGYLNANIEPKKYNDDKYLGQQPLFLRLKKIFNVEFELKKTKEEKGFIKSLINNIKTYYWFKEKYTIPPTNIQQLIDVDKVNLQNLIDDLNICVYKGQHVPKITIEQKNIFFIALDYYHLILELGLHKHSSVYKQWLYDFRDTFVFKNITNQLDDLLVEERLKRCNKKVENF